MFETDIMIKNKRIFVFVKIFLTILLFYFLLQEINYEIIKLILKNLNLDNVALCFIMIVVQLLIQSYRWHLIL